MPAPTKAKAVASAAQTALDFIKRVKVDVGTRKVEDYAAALAAEKYDDAAALARLAIAEKAQKILNRISSAARAGQVDANALDSEKLRSIAGDALKDHQANLLMRNTLSTAYNAGYLAQGQQDPGTDFWLYETKRDAQVRPSHAKWDGLLLPKDNELAMKIFPPNGHNCRCIMTAISSADAAAQVEAGTATEDIPSIKNQVYVDKKTGDKIKTIEGVDPGWLGAPDDRMETTALLLERQIERLQATAF